MDMRDMLSKLKEDMKVAKGVLSFCNMHKAEFIPGSDSYVVNTPRQLSEEQQQEFRDLTRGEIPIKFVVAPKLQTTLNVENLLHRARATNGKVIPDLDHRAITIELEGVGADDPVWGDVSEALKQDGFFESWKFIIEGKETQVLPKVVEEMAKNKGRTHGISDGDVTDLKIGLANAQTIDDILKVMGG